MKRTGLLTFSLLLTGIGISGFPSAALALEPIEPNASRIESFAPGVKEALYFGFFDASFPGYVVEVATCGTFKHVFFWSENEPEFEQWDKLYIIDGDLYADPAGEILVATNYDDALAAFAVERQAEIAALLEGIGTTAPAPAVQPAPQPVPQPQVQPAPAAPVPALW